MYKLELIDLIEKFISFHTQTGMSENTLRAYSCDAKSFIIWLYPNKKNRAVLNDKALSKWQLFLHSESKAPKTIKRRFAALRAIFNWLKTNKYIKRNPFSEYKLSISIPKRDTSIKIRVPEVYRNAWQSAADQENASLSDWIYRKLKPLISVEEADK